MSCSRLNVSYKFCNGGINSINKCSPAAFNKTGMTYFANTGRTALLGDARRLRKMTGLFTISEVADELNMNFAK
jgi:hypothetical protein